ncbi:MAG TPA: hypothetical protein VFZ48_02650 [Candidatus Saccharimonadales bacterium]
MGDRAAFRAASKVKQQRRATDFEADVDWHLDPENAPSDPEAEIGVGIPELVSEDRINTVAVRQRAKGWRVEVEPKGTKDRFIWFTDPA